MDIGKIGLREGAERGAFCHLEHPGTGEPLYADDGTPIGIHLLGMDSREYREKETAIANRRLQRRTNSASVEQIRANGTELLAAITKDWQGIFLHGEEWECTESNAMKLYDQENWIREQVDRFVGDRGNFLPKSSTS